MLHISINEPLVVSNTVMISPVNGWMFTAVMPKLTRSGSGGPVGLFLKFLALGDASVETSAEEFSAELSWAESVLMRDSSSMLIGASLLGTTTGSSECKGRSSLMYRAWLLSHTMTVPSRDPLSTRDQSELTLMQVTAPSWPFSSAISAMLSDLRRFPLIRVRTNSLKTSLLTSVARHLHRAVVGTSLSTACFSTSAPLMTRSQLRSASHCD